MIKLRLKPKITAPELDEAAKWRGTSFNTEITQDEIERLVSKYGADVLGAHYDSGVPTGLDTYRTSPDDPGYASKLHVPARSRGEEIAPQTSFNPKAKWDTPVGIYYYPLSWAKDRIMNNYIPFAGDKQYIYIYRIYIYLFIYFLLYLYLYTWIDTKSKYETTYIYTPYIFIHTYI